MSDPKIKITEIVTADLDGYCDVETGECVIPDSEAVSGEEIEGDQQGREGLQDENV